MVYFISMLWSLISAAERQRKAEEAKAAAATRREAKIQAKREADEKRRIAAERKYTYMSV